MNITKTNIDDLNAVLKVKVGPEDYKQKVETTLKDYAKKAQMPGFRPGKVPAGMIKKMYGKSVLVDEINKLLSDSLYKYITENKLDVLGNPLPKHDEAKDIDWESQNEFEFSYELGLAPQIDYELSPKEKFTREIIKVDDKLIDKYVTDIRKNFGQPSNPEVAEETDVIFGDLVELDATGEILPGGIFKSSTIAIERLKNAEMKKKFIGLKKEDAVTITPTDLTANDSEIAKTLNADKTDVSYRLTVKNIARMQPSEVNQELFDKVYGPGKVNSEEEFRNKIKEELSAMFIGDSDKKLKNTIIETLMDKVKVTLPDEFLKRWLVAVNEKPVTYDEVDREYDRYSKSLKWQLIENKLLKDNEVKVSHEEALDHVKKLIKDQYARYGNTDVNEEELTKTANTILKKEEEAKKIYENIYDQKLMDLFKTKLTIEDKEVNYEDFYKSAK